MGKDGTNRYGWRYIHRSLIEATRGEAKAQSCNNAFHEKAGRQAGFCFVVFCCKFSHRQGSPFAPVAAVATLPSAVVMRLWLAASWVFLGYRGAATCESTSFLSAPVSSSNASAGVVLPSSCRSPLSPALQARRSLASVLHPVLETGSSHPIC